MKSKKTKLFLSISGISLFSVILLSSGLLIGIPEVSAITEIRTITFSGVSADFNDWTTGTGSPVGADKIAAILDFDGPLIHDGDASYITSIINNDIQGFVTIDTFDRVESINYINVTSIGHKVDEARKATKFSQGVATGGVPIALPNGGVELQSGYTVFTQIFETNPFTGKNVKNQDPWLVSDLEDLEYIIEQNTDTKEVRVTEFIVEISLEIIPPEISIASVTPDATPKWDHEVELNLVIVGALFNSDKVEIDWGDGSGTEIIDVTADNMAVPHTYAKEAVGGNSVTVTLTNSVGAFWDDDTTSITVLKHDTTLGNPELSVSDIPW